jgi:hypothetical protein
MTDAEIQAQIAATQALAAENQRLMDRLKEVSDELNQTMADHLGCSIWDLDNQLDRDLDAEQRQALEAQAMALLREHVPDLPEPAAEPSPEATATPPVTASGMPVPGSAPRAPRRMV